MRAAAEKLRAGWVGKASGREVGDRPTAQVGMRCEAKAARRDEADARGALALGSNWAGRGVTRMQLSKHWSTPPMVWWVFRLRASREASRKIWDRTVAVKWQ